MQKIFHHLILLSGIVLLFGDIPLVRAMEKQFFTENSEYEAYASSPTSSRKQKYIISSHLPLSFRILHEMCGYSKEYIVNKPAYPVVT